MTRLKGWVILALKWALRQLEPPAPVVSAPPNPLLEAAIASTSAVRQWDASGEAKRHQVYAELQKAFPDVAKRVISRAIEEALDRWPSPDSV